MIRHFVHLRFRSNVEASVKAALYARLEGLKEHIDGIVDFQCHENISVETPLVRGFVDMFWFDFRDEAVRAAYLDDPTHQAIGADIVAQLEGGADGVFVCDVRL